MNGFPANYRRIVPLSLYGQSVGYFIDCVKPVKSESVNLPPALPLRAASLQTPLRQLKNLTHFTKTVRQSDIPQRSSKLIYYGTPFFRFTQFEENVARFIPRDSNVYTCQFEVRNKDFHDPLFLSGRGRL